MLSFELKDGRFNFRSVAVIIKDNHLLIHQAVGDDFWALPGGRVELHEPSKATVVRELKEELDLDCEVERHLWYVENFYEYSTKKYHEIANYYLVNVPESTKIAPNQEFPGIEESVNLVFCWVPIESVSNYNLKPNFLIKNIVNLPASTVALFHNG